MNTAFVQADFGCLDPIQSRHGHAHGVGADASVHSKNRLVYGAKLRLSGSGEEHNGSNSRECGSIHRVISLESEPKREVERQAHAFVRLIPVEGLI